MNGAEGAIDELLHPNCRLFNHRECINIRLQFLKNTLLRVDFEDSLSEEQIDAIFEHFYRSGQHDVPVLEDERRMCLGTFLSCFAISFAISFAIFNLTI